MAKYSFTVSGSQLIVSLVPVLDDVQPTSMSYLAPSFKIGVGKINAYEYGQPKQSFLFTEIGEIDGVAPTDLQDAFDKLTALAGNFNGGGTAPYKVYTALLTQTGTDAPVATVLENTLGGDVVWTRFQEGDYEGALTNAFVTDKTASIISNNSGTNDSFMFLDSVSDESVVYLTTFLSGVKADNQLNKTTINIKVYN